MRAKFLALAALVLGLASCQTDTVNGVKVDANGEAPVTIQVGLPEDVTRAAGNDSAKGAIGNIDLENTYDIRYVLNVYDKYGKLAKGPITEFQDEATSQSFSLRLVPGRYYKFVVWADFVKEGSKDALYYDVTNFTEIKTLGTHNAMDESRDAYTGFVEVANFKGTQGIDKIILTRPFAKLRVVTTDIDQLYSDLQSARVVYTTKLYTTFNAVTAEPTGLEEVAGVTRTVDFTDDDAAYKYSNEPVQGKEQTLFADYLFGGENDCVKFTLDVTDATSLPIPQVVFNTNIPVQRNYLTTIKGNVLTDANTITVEIEEAFAGEYVNGSDVDTTESFADALADAAESVEATIDLTGDVVWSTGAGIGSTPWIPEGAKTKKLTVNANGHKITATGAGVGAIRMANGGTLVINNAIIKDESVSYAENSWEYGYLEFAGKLQFNECEFVNAIMVEDADATFVGCKFNSNDDNQYAVWVSGNNASFKNCVVEGPRGIKMHEAYGSEIKQVVINKCQFNNIYKKPGVAIGDVNADAKVVIMNSSFTHCAAGDQGLYIYETDTDVTTFDFTQENNFVDGVNKVDDNTYKISSAEGFEYIVDMVNGGETDFNVVLNNDIDLSQYAITRSAVASNWTPIGTSEKPFSGTFDGNNCTIKNLALVEPEAKEGKAYIGFFGYAKNATIKNVTFENVYINIPCLDIDHSQGHIGAVAGSLEGNSTIENVTVKGDITVYATQDANGASRVAVVAGGNSYGNVTMKNVHVNANEGSSLIANNNTGALAGQLQGKMVFENCSSNIDVTVNKFFAGGLVGIAAGDSTFTNCHTTGDIAVVAGREGRAHDQYRVGGIAGGWADGAKNVCTLTNCSYTGNVSGENSDGSVANPLDYAGYVGRGYTLNGCQGSKVVINGVEYVQAFNTAAEAGVYYVDGVLTVSTADQLIMALEAGENVLLANDIKIDPANMSNAYGKTGINVKNGQTIDGGGHILNIKGAGGTWDSGINTTGGVIKNITVTGSFRGIFINHNSDHSEKVVLENVTIGGNGTVYTISCDQGLYQGIEATNCTFNGWTSFAKTAGEAKFVNCSFGEGSGYKYCRPYSNTEFVNCIFCPGYAVDQTQATVTFTDCTWQK